MENECLTPKHQQAIKDTIVYGEESTKIHVNTNYHI